MQIMFSEGSQVKSIPPLTAFGFFDAACIAFDDPTNRLTRQIREVPYYQGVTFFFVLSGFTLTYSHKSTKDFAAARSLWIARFAADLATFAPIALSFLFIPDLMREYSKFSGIARIVIATLCIQSWFPVWDYGAMMPSNVSTPRSSTVKPVLP